ncbi:MAG: sugar transferase [bacterium]|nr:sugar transferase [bacterium]
MKRTEAFFTVILVPLDYLALLLAGLIAYALRYADFFANWRPIIFDLPFYQYWQAASLIALVWLVIFALAGLYNPSACRKKLEEFKKVMLACSTGFAAVLAIMVFSRQLFDSRFILLVSWFLAIVFVLLFRLLWRAVKNILHRAGVGLKQLIVIGQGSSLEATLRLVRQNPKMGFAIAAYFPELNEQSVGKIKTIFKEKSIDQILFINPEATLQEMHAALDLADQYHCSFRYSVDPLVIHGAGLEFDTLAGVPLVEIKRTRLEGWGRIYKRIFDVIGSLLLIVITSPLMILAALLTLLENGLPVLFHNERVGEHGQFFNTLKFRTMHKKFCVGKQFTDQTEALKLEEKLIKEKGIKEGPVYKIKDDPRVTRFGRVIRRLSLDELPQLFNVLAGQMSLIGPRPHQPREVEKYDKHHKRVLAIKPGITGLAQISGRSDLTFEEEVALDTYYMEHWSLKLDLIILFKTPFIVLFSRGAY